MSGENSSATPQPISVSPSQAWDGNDGPWSSFILGIGTPLQYVHVLVSTTCPQPWAVDPQGCTSQDPPDCATARGNFFFTNTSSTWRDAGPFELDQELNLGYTGNGDFGFDTVALGAPGSTSGSYILQNQILATIAAKDFYIATWGIAPRPTNLTTISAENSYPSLLATLRKQNKIPSLSYAYTAGAPYRLKKFLGSLTFGGFDASRFNPSNISFSFAPDNSRDLVVGIQSITFGSQDSGPADLLPTPILSFIDSTISHIWLPISSCHAFEAAFGISWDPLSELYLVNESTHNSMLAQNASLTFQISTDETSPDSVDIVLPYASFDLEVRDTYPNVNSTTRYFPLKRAANDSQYTLGRTFLQEAYLIVDYERSNFSVHPCIFSENLEESIQPILPINATNPKIGPPTMPSLPHAPLLSTGTIAGIVLAALALVTLLSALFWTYRRRRSKAASGTLKNLDISQCLQEFEVEGEMVPKIEIDGVARAPELHDQAKVEVDGGIAMYEVIDKTTAVHELP